MIQISDLVLEVTRKCNLQCAHCLRGKAQRMSMSNAVLFKAMGSIESIGTLTLAGGEPSLAPEVLEYLFENLYMHKIQVGSFYIVTNGMPHNRFRRFLTAVERLYGWCDSQGSCMLTVSRDQYHPFNQNPGRYLRQFEIRDEHGGRHWEGEYPPYFYPGDRNVTIHQVIGEGRAVETQVGFEPQEQQTPWEVHTDGNYVIEPVVYVSANGNVTSSCNMSFERLDREAKGNVLTKYLPDIIESYCTIQEEVKEEVA